MQEQHPDSLYVEIVAGALIGLGSVAVLEMLSIQTLDIPLTISLYSFAVSIPSLAAVVLSIRAEHIHRITTAVSASLEYLLIIGGLASLVGVGGIFFHFGRYVGCVFAVVSLIGFIAWVRYAGEKLSE